MVKNPEHPGPGDDMEENVLSKEEALANMRELVAPKETDILKAEYTKFFDASYKYMTRTEQKALGEFESYDEKIKFMFDLQPELEKRKNQSKLDEKTKI